jgi:hypothetical protein
MVQGCWHISKKVETFVVILNYGLPTYAMHARSRLIGRLERVDQNSRKGQRFSVASGLEISQEIAILCEHNRVGKIYFLGVLRDRIIDEL